MRRFALAVLLSMLCLVAFGAGPAFVPIPSSKFDFHGVSVAAVVQLVYSEALHVSYVIDPDVLTDQRLVSFRFDGSKGELNAFVASFLDSLGMTVTRRAGIDFVTKKPSPATDSHKEGEVLIYRPKHRDGTYLVELLGPLFSGSFTSKHSIRGSIGGDGAQDKVTPAGSAAASVDQKSDTLVFSGTLQEVTKLKHILSQVDVAVGDVLVRGVLYEVQTEREDGSALGLALNLLGSSVKLGFGPSVAASPGSAFMSFKNRSIDSVLSVLGNDSRFKAVSKPMLRVTSGGTGRFKVDPSVKTL